jgi:branched-chain amino acid transport system ATP-binding protein
MSILRRATSDAPDGRHRRRARQPEEPDGPLLEVQSLSAGYGDLRAVWDVSLTVEPGQVTALLGPNGAGKTTTVMAISGMVSIFGGSVRCGGIDMAGVAPYDRVSRGRIGVVQEGKRIFRLRTVEQNLRIGWWPRRHEGRAACARALEEAYAQFPILGQRRGTRAGLLSGGQQQMLAVAQALIAKPDIVVLDEPSAGLAPSVVHDVLQLVDRLRAGGLGILLVEQLVDAALSVADRVVVIKAGRSVMEGTPEGIGGRDGVRRAYLDEELGEDITAELAEKRPSRDSHGQR